MSAKFIAQIEISKPCVSSASRPAEATRPRIVSISGSPAATSEPKASTRIASVTGQEKSSDFIIAVRLAVLKSLHMPEAPVSETLTPSRAGARAASPLSVSAAATIAVGSPVGAGRHDRGVAVGGDARARRAAARPSATCAFARRTPLDASDRLAEAGVADGLASASGRRPSAPSWRGRRSSPGSASRAWTDSEPFACQPAPGERRLDPRREDAERDGDDDPGDRDGADVVGGPAAEPADRADRLRLLERGRARRGSGVSTTVTGSHR